MMLSFSKFLPTGQFCYSSSTEEDPATASASTSACGTGSRSDQFQSRKSNLDCLRTRIKRRTLFCRQRHLNYLSLTLILYFALFANEGIKSLTPKRLKFILDKSWLLWGLLELERLCLSKSWQISTQTWSTMVPSSEIEDLQFPCTMKRRLNKKHLSNRTLTLWPISVKSSQICLQVTWTAWISEISKKSRCAIW